MVKKITYTGKTIKINPRTGKPWPKTTVIITPIKGTTGGWVPKKK